MGTEHEKKFLLRENGQYHTTPLMRAIIPDDELTNRIRSGEPILQGYLPLDVARDMGMDMFDFPMAEARLRKRGELYFFGAKGDGDASRQEFETEITRDLFVDFWPQTEGRRVRKTRLTYPFFRASIEFDGYTDRDLIVAEIEVPDSLDLFSIYPLGKDITANKAYKNKNLAR